MFNNLVNQYDFFDLGRIGWKKVYSRLKAQLARSETEIVAQKWSDISEEPTHWWNVPAVCMRWNKLISGDPHVNHYQYLCTKYFKDRGSLHGLSLGCGDGSRELRWAESGKFEHIDAFDLSATQIEKANRSAAVQGYAKTVSYKVGDIYDVNIPADYYNAIIVEHSLHHFSPLKEILLKISKNLKPDGYFIINEFVGPTRFQWSDRQLEATNALLSVLPEKYRKLPDGGIKRREIKTSRLRMRLRDPSEAIESASILPLVRDIFDAVEIKEYGGTILQLLLDGIAQNFLSNDAETAAWLNICFEVEDALLASKDIRSDFVVAVLRRKA